MTKKRAEETILAAIKVDEGKEDKAYGFTERAYSECHKRIPNHLDREKFATWYTDLKRNFNK